VIAGIDVSSLIVALTGLVVAAGTIITNRSRQSALDADTLEKQRNKARRQLEAALDYIHDLCVVLARHGIDRPPRPPELDSDEQKASAS
jgi:hypothetical protein